VKKKQVLAILLICTCVFRGFPQSVEAQEDSHTLLLQRYEEYRRRFAAIEMVEDIEENGYEIIEDQSFPILLESFGEEEVMFIPAMDREYHRLAVMIADGEGEVLFKTDQLETNYKYLGQLEQPTMGIAAVSFKDLDQDGFTDIILITNCENSSGEYAGKTYKTGDVLFQKEGTFYRDWRISDKINRFSMNKSADFIAAYVQDGNSTEVLYTASTLRELRENGFQIIPEQYETVEFEKQGRLRVVPGYIRMRIYDIFMIYLVNEEGEIVWSFQPMDEYDNLYSLKGITCQDMDGDGMKDIVVLAGYSYAGADGELMVDVRCSVYYQRTDGFAEDTDFCDAYRGTEEDKVYELVKSIREYWGWPKEE